LVGEGCVIQNDINAEIKDLLLYCKKYFQPND
jgi:hypothetical protein